MKVLVELCVVPQVQDISVSPYIAACEDVLASRGLIRELHAYGTNIEGPWDEVFAAVKECHQVVHRMGAVRVMSVIKVATRTDREQSLADKVQSVEKKLKFKPGDKP